MVDGEEMQAIEENYKNKEIRNFYQVFKTCNQPHASAPQWYRDKKDLLIGDEEDKLKR